MISCTYGTPRTRMKWKAPGADTMSVSNGYGTLAEAGWTHQTPVHGALSIPGATLVMCQPQKDGFLHLCVGAYRQD